MATKQGKTQQAKRRARFETFVRHPGFCDMRRPIRLDGVDAMVTKGIEALDKMATLKEAYIKSGEAPKIPQIVFINLNAGIYSKADWAAALKQQEAWIAGTVKDNPELPSTYQPFRVDLAAALNCRCVLHGQASKHNKQPKDWDENVLGKWEAGDWISEPIRKVHPGDVTELVDDAEKSVVTINGVRYIVGDGSVDGSYPMIIHNSEMRDGGTNYGANEKVLGELSLAGVKNLVRIVGKVSNKPGDGFRIVAGGQSVTFLTPGQFATPGYLTRGEDILTPAQVRAAANGDAEARKGIKFVRIEQNDPAYRGALIDTETLWKHVRKAMSREALAQFEKQRRGGVTLEGEASYRNMVNVTVQCRVKPQGTAAFGFRAACIGVVTFKVVDADGKVSFGKAVGERGNDHLNRTSRDSAAEAAEVEAEAPKAKERKPREKKAPKPAAEKAPAEKAVAEKKPAKVPAATAAKAEHAKKALPEGDQPAAPVEAPAVVSGTAPIAEQPPAPKGAAEKVEAVAAAAPAAPLTV